MRLLFSKLLILSKKNLTQFETISELKNKALEVFKSGKLTLEYLEIVDQNTLTLLDEKNKSNLVACIAAYNNHIRLIDNMILS